MNWKNAGENRFYGWFRMVVMQCLLSLLGLRYSFSRRFLMFEVRRRLIYLLCSPWAISRHFLKQIGQDGAQQGYGETPLVTLQAVASRLELSSSDKLLELGSGTGRNCVWLADRYGCKVVGIEQVPRFVEVGQRLANRCFDQNEKPGEPLSKQVSLFCGDMFTLDMVRWQKVYVDCTAMSPSCIRRVAMLCAGLPDGATVITVNASLAQLMPERFQLETAFPGLFLWGWSDIRIQKVGMPEEEHSDVDGEDQRQSAFI